MIPPLKLFTVAFSLFAKPLFIFFRTIYHPKVKTSIVSQLLVKLGRSSYILEYKLRKSIIKVKKISKEPVELNDEHYFNQGLYNFSEVVLSIMFFLIGRYELSEYRKSALEKELNNECTLEIISKTLNLIEKDFEEAYKLTKID